MDTAQQRKPYIVVTAPGCYIDKTRISSAHDTPAEALRAAHHLGNRSVARAYWGRAGERWYSDLEHNAPILTWADAERT